MQVEISYINRFYVYIASLELTEGRLGSPIYI